MATKGTQIVFCDVGTPNSSKVFNVYDDIKKKLIVYGIPENEVCFIHDAKNEASRETMFSELRTGIKRIIIGSTSKMGTGTNIQNKLIALHHLDCPYRPSDIEQREGRILRQGNQNEEVSIYRYVTKNTFDSYLWAIVEQKQRFISQIMTSKSIARSAEDIDETVLSFAEVKAIATGNPLIKEKMQIDNEVARLNILKSAYNSQRFTLQDNFTLVYPNKISEQQKYAERIEKDIETRTTNKYQEFKIILGNEIYDDKEKAGEIIKSLAQKTFNSSDPKKIGQYNGFELLVRHNISTGYYQMILKGQNSYTSDIGESATGNITRLENILKSLDNNYKSANELIESYQAKIEQSKAEYNKPFLYEEQLKTNLIRQSELNMLLDIGKNDTVICDENEEEQNTNEHDNTEELEE